MIFSLDGLGLLGFEAAVNRDYPVMFGTLYIFTLIGLLLNIVADLTYALVDPRIDFERGRPEAAPSHRVARLSACRRSAPAGWPTSGPTAAATGRSGSSSSCSCSRCSPS